MSLLRWPEPGPTSPSLGYEISSTTDDLGVVAKITWTGPEDLTAEDLASAQPGHARELKAAAEWLSTTMDDHHGRINSVEAEGLARDEAGFSLRTLKRAKKKMGVRSKQEYDKSADGKVIRVWYWTRPDREPPDDGHDS